MGIALQALNMPAPQTVIMASSMDYEHSEAMLPGSPSRLSLAASKDDNDVVHSGNWQAHAIPVIDDIAEVEIEPVPCSSKVLSILFAPCSVFGSCYNVDVKTEAAVLHMGQLTEMQKKPGLHFAWPFGREIRTVSTKQQTMELPTSKIADAVGNPVMVSAILNYRVVDAKKAILSVENRTQYVNTNAQAVLKQTVSQYSYDQLKTDHDEVNERMRCSLQPILVLAGIEGCSMSLNDLSYAPEVAAAMLKRQQAKALVDARTLIVEGAVKIAQDAVVMLEGNGTVQLNDEQKVKIVTNLLTVTCSDTDATPTVSLQ